MAQAVYVYRSPVLGDCTNGGASASFNTILVVNVDGPEPSGVDRPWIPEYLLVDKPTAGQGPNPILVPAFLSNSGWRMLRPDGTVGPMFGGNYAASSDSRWTAATGGVRAVPIHDRFETPSQYAANFD